MRSLFLKIFVSYWLAQALFLVLAILVIFAFRQRGEFSEWQAQQATASQRAADVFERDGPAEVHRYLEELRESQHVRAYLFDEQGREVSGRAVPRWADSLSRGIRPPPREFWQHMAPSPFRRLPVTSAAGHSYTLAVMLPPGPFGPGGGSWLRHFDWHYFLWSGLLPTRALFDFSRCAPQSRNPAFGRGRLNREGRQRRIEAA